MFRNKQESPARGRTSSFSPISVAGLPEAPIRGRGLTRLAKKGVMILPMLVMVSLVGVLAAVMARAAESEKKRRPS